PRDLGVGHGDVQVLRDLLGERSVRVAGQELQLVRHRRLVPVRVVGAGGFEPPNTGSKVPRLATWPRPIVFASPDPAPRRPAAAHYRTRRASVGGAPSPATTCSAHYRTRIAGPRSVRTAQHPQRARATRVRICRA